MLKVVVSLVLICGVSGITFTKVGHHAGTALEIRGVGSGAFNASKLKNWVFDGRRPLISPHNTGTCPKNIYNANAVHNGKTGWNIFFGGWDGVSSCHDSISVVVTEDVFASFNPHYPMIATGSMVHVNNPSAIKVSDSEWLMIYTQLVPQVNLNKPGISRATNGIDWSPNKGGVTDAFVTVDGYPGWAAADVNGGNVLFYDHTTDVLHLFFIDFKTEQKHSVYHATSKGLGNLHHFTYQKPALAEPMRVVNDLKKINGHYLMGLHMNAHQVYYSVGTSLDAPFPPSAVLFRHHDALDPYIVSLGFVVDEAEERLMGAVYGAGADSHLDQNRVFGAWLQRRVLFVGEGTLWGLGDISSSGPDTAMLATNKPSLHGRFYVYDSDYVDGSSRGTLLGVSEPVVVAPGDVWHMSM